MMQTMEILDTTTLSVKDKEYLLTELNDDMANSMAPVIVFLVLLMIMGLVGNSFVCYYYGFKTRRTTSTIFICTVAIYDLLSCSLSIPMEIMDLRLFHMFTDTGTCKVLRFVNHFSSMGSAFTLVVIAVDRYNHICRPFKRQWTINESKIACGVSVAVSAFFSWPTFIFYGSVPVPVKNSLGVDLLGDDCTTKRDESYKLYLWLFNCAHFLLFIVSTIVLCVMYSLVGRVLLKHKKSRKPYPTPSSSNGNATISSNDIIGDTDVTGNDDNKTLDSEKIPPETPQEGQSETYGGTSANGHATFIKSGKSSMSNLSIMRVQTPNPLDIKTIKYTIIMLVITVVFIVSFLPYLSMVIWRAVMGVYEVDYLSRSGLVAFQFAIRSYFLNSAINPLTYGLFNSKFRHFIYRLVSGVCCKRFEKATFSSNSETA